MGLEEPAAVPFAKGKIDLVNAVSVGPWRKPTSPPAQTIQRWLRHSSLSTTLFYLADSDDESVETRNQVNRTFAFAPRLVTVA